jgi:hypothetical protein
MTATGESCHGCGTVRPVASAWRKGWKRGCCGSCYNRWQRHGLTGDRPPPPARSWEFTRAARLEDYTELRSWGLSARDTAARLGVSPRTVQRYARLARTTNGAAA